LGAQKSRQEIGGLGIGWFGLYFISVLVVLVNFGCVENLQERHYRRPSDFNWLRVACAVAAESFFR
jgi:hypothetical protein